MKFELGMIVKRILAGTLRKPNMKKDLLLTYGITIGYFNTSCIVLGCLAFPRVGKVRKALYKNKDIFKGASVKNVDISRIIEIVGQVGVDGMDYLLYRGYKFVLQIKNIDIIDDLGKMICRCSPDELTEFMRYNRMSFKEKGEWLSTAKTKLEGSKHVYNPEEALKLHGIDIPPSKPPNGSGLSPDFRDSPDYLFDNDPRFGNVEIRMTGSRDKDFKLLNDQFGFPKTPDEFVWHHLDEVKLDDAGELVTTMQLVKKEVHKKIVVPSQKGQLQALDDVVVAGEHVGSVAVWENFYLGVAYK